MEMLGNREAADYCGIPYRTWAAKYAIWGVPYFRIGKHIKFRKNELDKWIESCREA